MARVAHRAGEGALLAKADIKSAYHLVQVHPDDRPLLAVEWRGSTYVDGMLPCGLRSAPKVFTAVADALEWCLRAKSVVGVDHYLDDFVIVASPALNVCQTAMSLMQEECTAFGVALAPEKSEGPATRLTFLGIQIDTVAENLSLPQDKLDHLRSEVEHWLSRKSYQKRELESLMGLQYAARVIPPGRSFVRRMIELPKGPGCPCHYVCINEQFRADLWWWRVFAHKWNGVTLFLAPSETTVESRNNLSSFLSKVPLARTLPTPLPPSLVVLLFDTYGTWTSPNWTNRFMSTVG